MNSRISKNIRFYYGIIFGAFTVVVGTLFIWLVLSQYYSGAAEGFSAAHPFTRERVVKALSKIDLFFWLWVAGAIAGYVLLFVCPLKEKKDKISPELQYARLLKRMPASSPEGLKAEYDSVVQYNKLVFSLKCAAWSLFAAGAVYGVVYLAIPANFTHGASTEIANGEVIKMVSSVFPCIFAGFLVICGVGIYEKYTVKKRLSALRKITKGQKPDVSRTFFARVEAASENRWVVLGVRIALFVIAVTLIIVGALNGNMTDIFNKAVAICSQCIGLA